MSLLQTLDVLGEGSTQIMLKPRSLIVAGYTGRDEGAVREHIEELAAIGVPPPPQVPMLYDLDPDLLTSDKVVEVGPGLTSGEIEPVLIRHQGRWYLGVGSDLTDRDLEREDVKTSKAACPKPLGRTVLPLPEDVATGGFDDVWGQTQAMSYVDGEPYQKGSLASLRPPSDLIPRVVEAIGSSRHVEEDVVVFAGTLPLIGGEFRAGAAWEARLTLPEGPTLNHQHEIMRPIMRGA